MSDSLYRTGFGPILDSTLRDGRYLGKWGSELTTLLVAELAACRIMGIEIGPELGLGDTSSDRFGTRKLIFADIEAASSVKSESLIGCFFIPGLGAQEDLINAKEAGLDFVRIGQNPTDWSSAIAFIEIAISLELRVFFNLMKSHLVSPDEFANIAEALSEFPLDGVYLVDSTGNFTPDDVRTYVQRAREHTSCPIGFHGHDNLGLAHANSLMAWTCGANVVDGTLLGIGRGGGNASTERLVGLRRRAGFENSVDLHSICEVAFRLRNGLDLQIATSDHLDITCGINGFHSSWLTIANEVAKTYGLACDQVIEGVSKKNRENPSRELFEEIARELASSRNSTL